MLGLAVGLLIGGPLAIVLLVLAGLMVGHQVDELHELPSDSEGHEEPVTRSAPDLAAQDHFARAHYARLGLTPEASDADVKRAFRQLAATHHPDRVAHLGQGAVEQASRRFQEIRESYEEIRRLRGR